MKILEINCFKDFIAIKNTWDSLLKDSNTDVFSTWEWLTTWWKYFGKKKKLLILLAQENNKILGIAPLMYSPKRFFGVNQGIIEFIGAENLHTGYNDFIILDQHKKCIEEFINYLNDLPDNWIYATFRDIPEKSKSLSSLNIFSKKVGLSHECLAVPLAKSFDSFLKQVQNRARKSFKTKYRRLKKQFEFELVNYSDLNLVTQGMNSLFDLHQKRWEIKGGFEGMFAD
jgi:CelD/BcsL family acetyltransferase involved in cellulose biosynthesis